MACRPCSARTAARAQARFAMDLPVAAGKRGSGKPDELLSGLNLRCAQDLNQKLARAERCRTFLVSLP
eukprot:1143533-Pelagomonas_calceolata.AAC.2